MSERKIIITENAPQAIGTYSQAIKVENWLYVSGQIPLDPKTMQVVDGDFVAQVQQAFTNLKAVLQAAHGDTRDVIKLTIYLLEMDNFSIVNEVMQTYFEAPYPARAVVAVAGLPKAVSIEMDAVAYIA